MQMPWLCAYCEVEDASLKECMNHFRRTHFKLEADFELVCGIDQCELKYHVYDSWYRHVIRKHAEYYYGRRRMRESTLVGLIGLTEEGGSPSSNEDESGQEADSDEESLEEGELDEDEVISAIQDTNEIESITTEQIEQAAEEDREGDIIEELTAEVEEHGDSSTHFGQMEILDQKAAIYIMGLKAKHNLTQVCIIYTACIFSIC